MTPRLITPATAADAPALQTLIAAFYAEERLTRHAGADAALAQLLADRALGRVLIARQEGIAIGYALLSFSFSLERGGRVGLLDELFVLPAARGQGVAKALLAALRETARALHCRALLLEVDAANEKARRLYTGAGFRLHARHVMELPLD